MITEDRNPQNVESTFVSGPRQGRRIVVALFSGVVVVFALFVAMKFWVTAEKKKAMSVDPSAGELIDGKAPPPRSWTPSVAASAVAH